MSRGRRIDDILQPLTRQSNQYFLGNGLHTLGLLGWILSQTGRADVWVSTFSTSDAFCSDFLNLRKKGLIGKASLVADLKALRKTIQLAKLMSSCFDNVYLAQNHSKIVLVQNERWTVSVISSQNQTYGDRAECTMVTTSQQAFLDLYTGLDRIIKKSIDLNGLFERVASKDRGTPSEISALLGIDETELTDDINTLGHPARSAFFHGVAITAREIREDIRDAARAGSPFSVSECLSMIERQLSSVTMI